MNLERRYISNRAEQSESGIHGIAAVFYRDDNPGTEYKLWANTVERIMPGAFDRAVAEDDVRALFNHDPSWVLGRTKAGTMRLSVEEAGLAYHIEPSETRNYSELAAMLKRGDVDGSSFSFIVNQETWIKEGDREIRQIEAVQLYDVGPVTYPAYAATEAWTRGEDFARRSYDEWIENLRRERATAERNKSEVGRALRAAQLKQLTMLAGLR